MMRVLLGGVQGRSALAAATVFVLGSILSVAPAQADAPSTPKILLHLLPTVQKNKCTRADMITDCNLAVTNGVSAASAPPTYYMYLLVATGPLRSIALGGNGEGVGGMQCGITYNAAPNQGVDMFGWSICATLEFQSGSWPNSGGGNLITWDATVVCQTGDIAVAGYFYVSAYSPDEFKLVPRFVDNLAKVAKCSSFEINLPESDLGSAKFSALGNENGINPCLATPVERTTWSTIKGQYDRN